jgi:hypothetical protein
MYVEKQKQKKKKYSTDCSPLVEQKNRFRISSVVAEPETPPIDRPFRGSKAWTRQQHAFFISDEEFVELAERNLQHFTC